MRVRPMRSGQQKKDKSTSWNVSWLREARALEKDWGFQPREQHTFRLCRHCGLSPAAPRTPRQATRRRCEAGFLASRVNVFRPSSQGFDASVTFNKAVRLAPYAS